MPDLDTTKKSLTSKKQHKFVAHKIIEPNSPTLSELFNYYINETVIGGSQHTADAKINDIQKFISFFTQNMSNDHPDLWTVSVTKQFKNELINYRSVESRQKYKANTINRILATIRHAARWIHKKYPFKSGFPFEGVKDLHTDNPDWKGLTKKQIMQLKAACDIRMKACTRQNQNSKLEVALFYCLLYTGMRRFEILLLNIQDYYARGFHNVKRKGSKITDKVPLPAEAKEKLDLYLETRPDRSPDEPLFLSRYGNRLQIRDANNICSRILKQVIAHLPEDEKFKLTPHMLRHTFLRKAADKEGIHIAYEFSGNVSMKEIFRYTKPSQDEKDAMAENFVF